jgi:TonB-linked SusC/RagA family outer membrane protein
MEYKYRYIFSFLIVFFICAGIEGVNAQDDTTVSGVVTDAETDVTIPGVNILVQGTNTGAATNENGQYSLTVPSLQDSLVFSFVGYQTKIVPINGRTEINVELVSETVAGQEVVVVGYGTRTKETLTGSVSAVSGEKLEKVPVTNMSNTLSGRIPGIITITGSGEPGYDNTTIRIRGNQTLNNNDPLIVIDGVPSRAGGLDRLNPEDIENVSVLKDASAAIYGARAANGVILITTKRGSGGPGGPEFELKVNQGFNQPTRVPEMADAEQYMRMINEIDFYRGRELTHDEETIQFHAKPESEKTEAERWLYPDTDWFSEVMKPMSYQTKADMSLSGGNQDVTYFLSLGGLTEDGFYENSATRYNQISFRSNIDGHINDWMDIRFDVTGRFEDRNFPNRSAGQIFRMTMRGKPHLPAKWPNGLPGPDIENGTNPVTTATPETGYTDDEEYYFQSNIGITIDVPGVEGLGIRGNVTYDKWFESFKSWRKPWTLYQWERDAFEAELNAGNNPNPADFLTGAPRGFPEPQLFQRSAENYNILANLIAEYQRDIGDHTVGALVGTERMSGLTSSFNAFRRFYISDQIDELFAGGEEEKDNFGTSQYYDGPGGFPDAQVRFNFFSRLNYDYQDKYLIELVGRYDGSYIFPEGNRFGFFPGVSVGWRISQEDFFADNIGFFNDLKLRASYGQTGNDSIEPFQFVAPYGFGSGRVFGDGSIQPTISQTRTPNPDITWENANQFDVGITGSILDDHLSFEVDYYDYLRTEILWFRNASIPQTSGLSLPRENIGEVRAWGADGTVTYRNQAGNDFFYDITANFSYALNEIKYFDEPPGAEEWQQATGKRMNTGLFYIADGIYQTQEEIDNSAHWNGARPGDVIFRDVNGDGEITSDDRVRINENGTPKFTGGLEFTASYQQFDFTMLLQGAAGAVVYTQTESGEIGNFRKDFADNRWIGDLDGDGSPDRPSETDPRTWNRGDEYWASNGNTYFLQPRDYLRLKTLEIGYSMPASFLSQTGLRDMRIYANGFNLLTFSELDYLDPEAQSGGGQYYPQKRVFNVGLSVSF